MMIDLRTMDDKIRLWLGAENMDQDDRQALETVRDLISDLISRPRLGDCRRQGGRTFRWPWSSGRG